LSATDSALTATNDIAITVNPAPPSSPALWRAGMEGGNLNEWSLNSGGGEFDSGSADSVPSQDVAHSGTWSAKMTLSTAGSGTRLFRWAESQSHTDLYYSVWYYYPQKYNIGGWQNIFQWKSKHSAGVDPFFYLVPRNRSNGNMHLTLDWWPGLTIEGPHAGESGGRTYDQGLKDIPVGQWFQIEAHYVCSGDFAGHLTVWQDGVQLFDLSNVRTRYLDGDCQWSVNNYGDNISPMPVVTYSDDAAISTTRIGH